METKEFWEKQKKWQNEMIEMCRESIKHNESQIKMFEEMNRLADAALAEIEKGK